MNRSEWIDLVRNVGRTLTGPERLRAIAERARAELRGRVVWNVNATATGGGVAEMLQFMLAYGRGAGVDGGDDEVAGEAGLQRDGRGLAVPDLPDEEDLGVLAEEGAERPGEIAAALLGL